MKILLVYWHSEEQSFNAAMRDTAILALQEAGHEVRVSDLRRMNFDPVSDRRNFTSVKDDSYFKQQIEELNATEVGGFAAEITAEQEKLEWCELMIWQFPLWWFGLPAVLKGWVDRVFAMGKTYGLGKVYTDGFFSGKRAMLSLTTGGPEEAYLPGGFNGDMMGILRPIHRGDARIHRFFGAGAAGCLWPGPSRREPAPCRAGRLRYALGETDRGTTD